MCSKYQAGRLTRIKDSFGNSLTRSALCTITSYNNAHDAVVCEQKIFPKKLGCGRCSQIGRLS